MRKVETIGADHIYLNYSYSQAKGCNIKLFPTITQLIQARETIRLLVPYFKKYWQRLFWGILALLSTDLIQLYIPRVIKQAVDSLQLGQATSASLLRQGGLILSFAIGIALFRFTWRYLVLGFSRLLERDLRNLLLSRLVRLDRPFFNRRSADRKSTRLNSSHQSTSRMPSSA